MPGALVCGLERLEHPSDALSVAARLALRLRLRLEVVHVVGGRQAWPSSPRKRDASELLSRSGAPACEQAVSVRIEAGDPADRLLKAAVAGDAELVVVGCRGRGPLKRTVLGSVSSAVIARCACPVVVVPAGVEGTRVGKESTPSVVCGVDGSEESFAATSLASDLAVRLQARLILAHVYEEEEEKEGAIPVEYDHLLQGERRPGLKTLHRAAALISHRITPEVRLEAGDPAARLDDLAVREGAELLVVASRRLGTCRARLLGSVSSRLAAAASVPVAVMAPHVHLASGSGNYEFREVIL
jgi:nucleotide-binding universal stress UspA family protein